MCKLFLSLYFSQSCRHFVEKCTSRRIIPHPIQLFRFNSLEMTWFQGDLEEIEQDVEEQIQIAIANGEFDNIEG